MIKRTALLRTLCVFAFSLASSSHLLSLHAQPTQPEIPEAEVIIEDVVHTSERLQYAQDMPASQLDQLIIKYRDDQPSITIEASAAAQMSRLSAQAGIALTYFRPMSGDAHVLRLPGEMPVDEVERIAARLSALPEVEYAEPDYIVHTVQTRIHPNDPLFSWQWHYVGPIGIRLPLAWGITRGSNNTVVAVIDTGHTRHTDLRDRFLGGYDFVSDVWRANDGDGRDPIPLDPGDWCSSSGRSSWHGTHVAGTIAANTNNRFGVTGVNWHAKLLSVRVIGRCGGNTSDVVDGMRWAAGLSVPGVPPNRFPAKVLNMSLRALSSTCPSTYQSAINAVNAAGRIVVVAAGNDNMNAAGSTPANCSGVITVGATNRGGTRAPYSNFGPVVDVSAPGGGFHSGVLSTFNSGMQRPVGDAYAYMSGTSMAAPHVAGVVSLMVALRPGLRWNQAEHILKTTARPIRCDRGPGMCGAGLVDAYEALRRVALLSTAAESDLLLSEQEDNSN